MDEKIYTVLRIEGEYAYLQSEGIPTDEPLFIAMALLPPGTDEGMRLCYKNFEFEII